MIGTREEWLALPGVIAVLPFRASGEVRLVVGPGWPYGLGQIEGPITEEWPVNVLVRAYGADVATFTLPVHDPGEREYLGMADLHGWLARRLADARRNVESLPDWARGSS